MTQPIPPDFQSKEVPLVVYIDGVRHIVGTAKVTADDEGFRVDGELNAELANSNLYDVMFGHGGNEFSLEPIEHEHRNLTFTGRARDLYETRPVQVWPEDFNAAPPHPDPTADVKLKWFEEYPHAT